MVKLYKDAKERYGMKSDKKVTEIFLKKQLKHTKLKDKDRESIENVLLFLKEENNEYQKKWNEFIKQIKKMEKEWSKKYPVKGYRFELRISDTKISDTMHSLTLQLVGETYSTWVFCVEEFQDSVKQIFFSSVQKDSDETEMASLEETITYIENFLESKDFLEFAASVENVSK